MEKKPIVQIFDWYVADNFLYGKVVDHPRFKAGHFIRTSEIRFQDNDRIETRNTKYNLIGTDYFGRKE